MLEKRQEEIDEGERGPSNTGSAGSEGGIYLVVESSLCVDAPKGPPRARGREAERIPSHPDPHRQTHTPK